MPHRTTGPVGNRLLASERRSYFKTQGLGLRGAYGGSGQLRAQDLGGYSGADANPLMVYRFIYPNDRG